MLAGADFKTILEQKGGKGASNGLPGSGRVDIWTGTTPSGKGRDRRWRCVGWGMYCVYCVREGGVHGRVIT